MQISRRRGSVPPRLNDSIRPISLRTYSGAKLGFPTMPLEEIVAEKVIRTFNKTRTDTPRGEDLYDLGLVSPRDVRRRDLLGGLIHEYHGRAA